MPLLAAGLTAAGLLVVLGLSISFASPLTKDQVTVLTAGIVGVAGGFVVGTPLEVSLLSERAETAFHRHHGAEILIVHEASRVNTCHALGFALKRKRHSG